MTCPKCNKLAKRETIATATKVIDGHTVIVSRREAMVCDKHGVLVWDPPVQTINPVPYVPQPLVPWQPSRFPGNPFGSGGVIGDGSPRPFNICSTGALA